MSEIVQQININVVDTPTLPGTGSGIAQISDFVTHNGASIAIVVAVVLLFVLTFFLFRRRPFRGAKQVRLGVASIAVILLSVLTLQFVAPILAATTLSLGNDTINVTITKPSLSTTASDTLTISGDNPIHDHTAFIDSISDARITIALNSTTLTGSETVLTSDTYDSSHTLNYVISITSDLPAGSYTAAIIHNIIDKTDNSESWMFTIDTRMTDTLDNDPSHYSGTATSFIIPLSGLVYGGYPTHPYDWIIDWGDGSTLQNVSGTSWWNDDGILHDYTTPGEYQVTIKSNGEATDGWMNAFGFYYGSTPANDPSNVLMFKSIDSPLPSLSRTEGAQYRFAYMFTQASNAIGIPADLFSLISTSGDVDFSNMFYETFGRFALNSTSATLPTGLFSTIDTSDGTNLSGMFGDTFQQYANNSPVMSIPSGLFASINTSGAVDMSYMFSGTFRQCGYYSLNADIPSGLFGAIDTSSATDMSYMFNSTFNSYGYNSTIGTIPTGLFDTINTSAVPNLNSTFQGTLSEYATQSTAGAIPTGLLSFIDLSSATDVTNIFTYMFNSFASSNTTPTTDINDIWGTANFAGRFTAANTGGFMGAFYQTFYNVPSITGLAQTFITNKLGGITPSSRAYTFTSTNVTDLAAIPANWK